MRKDFFYRYTKWLIGHRPLVMVVMVVLLGVSVFGIINIRINTDFRIFMPKDSPYMKNMERLEAQFGGGSHLLLLLETDEAQLSYRMVQDLLQIEEGLQGIPGVKHVQIPLPDIIPIDGKQTDIDSVQPDHMEIVRSALASLHVARGIILHEGSRYIAIQVLIDPELPASEVFRTIESTMGRYPYPYSVSGEPYLQAKIFDYILRIILFLPPAAVLCMLLVFRWRIGSMKATVLALFPAGIGAVLTLGVIGWVLGTVSLVTAIVPIFIIVMGSADGLHFCSHALDSLDEHANREQAVEQTLRAVGVPMIMTTVTTMIGFLSMLFIQSGEMRTMGVVAALGIFLAGAATWFFLPVLLYTVPGLGVHRRAGRNLSPLLASLQGKRAYLLTGAVLLLALPGIGLIKADFNMLSFYKQGTEVRKGIEKINSLYGGSLPVSITFSPVNGELLSPETAERVLALEEELRAEQLSETIVSLYDVISGIRASIQPAKEPGYPKSLMQARMLAAMVMKRQPDTFSTLYNRDVERGRVMVFLKDLSNETLSSFEETVKKYGEELQTEIAGVPFTMKEMNEQIIPQQLFSLLFAAAMVFLLSALLQRSVRIAAITVVPVIITLIALFGTMGYTGIALSIVTGIMSGLTIGVGIDYAIHFVSLYRYFDRQKDSDPTGTALRYVSSPVAANALGLAIGFSVMNFSPLKIHTYLSILMWVTMIVSALLSLTLIPTMLRRKE